MGELELTRERVWGLVALGALVIGVLGVFQFEFAQGGGSSFRVAFPMQTAPGPGVDATLSEGQSASKTLDIGVRNVTRVEFSLRWTDDLGDPDSFRFTITDPQGIARSAEGSGGALSVAFDGIAQAPPDERILAASAQDAAARIAARATTSAAVGAWRADVTLTSAPGTRVGGVEVQPDGKNAWTLTSRFSVYAASVVQG